MSGIIGKKNRNDKVYLMQKVKFGMYSCSGRSLLTSYTSWDWRYWWPIKAIGIDDKKSQKDYTGLKGLHCKSKYNS